MKNKYIWERKPDPKNGFIYEFKVNQTDLVSVYISTQNKTNSNEMAFEINEKSDFLSGLNNFHKLYETLFDICCDYIITTECHDFVIGINMTGPFGPKVKKIYSRLVRRKWTPMAEKLGLVFHSEYVDGQDLKFKWIRQNP